MKKIIKNYLIRDPKDIVFSEGSNYKAINFNASINNQKLFDDVIPINSRLSIVHDKTEMYVNGVRYVVNIDYIINRGTIEWISDIDILVTDNLTFILR